MWHHRGSMKPSSRAPDWRPLLALSAGESTPLWLALARAQAKRRRPADVATHYARGDYFAPCPVDQRLLHTLDGLALAAAHEFEALQLSPVAPLGACSVLAPTSQDRTLSAARGAEVVSDPTNVLALECALRLRASPRAHVRLCTVHQVLRCQPLPPGEHFARHFRLFALAEAGRARAEHGFTVAAIVRHVAVFDRLFSACEAADHRFPDRFAQLFASERGLPIADRVHERLGQTSPHVTVTREPLTATYYDGVRVLFGARSTTGAPVPIADTGAFDWVAQLTSNRKHRLVASGVGLQLIPLMFGAPG